MRPAHALDLVVPRRARGATLQPVVLGRGVYPASDAEAARRAPDQQHREHPAPAIALLLVTAVLASAWVGGLGPGLLSTVLVGFMVAFSGLPSASVSTSPAGNLLLPVLFVALGAGVSIACGARKRAEAGRRESEARFRALFGAEMVGIAFCDR